jgi:N-acetylmuramoyl-L-alanine amidase
VTQRVTRLRRTFMCAVAIGALVAAVLVLAPDAQARTFKDVGENDWFYHAVEAIVAEGGATGYSDGTFRPYEPVTRAQFTVMVASVLHLPDGDGTVFRDVRSTDSFAKAAGALYQAAILQGDTAGMFRPHALLSREQAASLAMRAVSFRLARDATVGDAQVNLMTDSAEAAPWLGALRDRNSIAGAHALAVSNAVRTGIVQGFSDQRFYPFLDLTRGQAAGIIYKALWAPLVVSDTPPAEVPAEGGYPTLEKGSSGPMVGWIERRLAALSYRPGAEDGVFDAATADAVMAFQKVERLKRDGTAPDAVQRRLAAAMTPSPRKVAGGSRMEVDLTRQVLFVVKNNRVQWTIPVASGREGMRTPTGTFTIQRKLPYWRESHLGFLYKPAYFYGGYAIHGAHSVPPYPASHGCVWVAVSTMDRLYPLLPIGTRVDIYY